MITIEEIKAQELDTQKYIAERCQEISEAVGQGLAVNALSDRVFFYPIKNFFRNFFSQKTKQQKAKFIN